MRISVPLSELMRRQLTYSLSYFAAMRILSPGSFPRFLEMELKTGPQPILKIFANMGVSTRVCGAIA